MIKTPSIEDLIFANKNIKRRLNIGFKGDRPILIDGRRKIIKATPCGFPITICASTQENYPHDPRFAERPYLFGFDEGDVKISFVNKEEAKIVLGVDYFEEKHEAIFAMLEACDGGPGLANAYSLGGTHHFGEMKYPYVTIPVQYYQIDPKRADSLALTDKELAKIRQELTE